MTIPGKVQSYMASGKPIIGSINGSCSNFILNNNVGYSCSSMDFDSLAKIIKNTTIGDLQQIGKRSKEVYFRKYCKALFMKKLISFLSELVCNKKYGY